MKTTIGIDLGTTMSVVAHVDEEGATRVLLNDNDERLTPSVVYFERAGEAVVGTEAKRTAPVAPDRVVTAIKRHMGTDYLLSFDGVGYRPEGISAIILRALAESAAKILGVAVGDLAAVVTVPAYFGTAEREATAAAARIAGIETLDLVAEPVAAALAYGVGSGERGSVLVYDLGGGTFDVTVIEFTDGAPRVVAVDGASQLGGLNFDERLGALLLERYVDASGDDEAYDDEEFVLRLHAEAEEAKKKFARVDTAVTTIARAGHSAKVAISREQFDEVIASLVDETIVIVNRVIASAMALGAPRPKQVLLTGGSTRIRAVTAALEVHLGVPVLLRDPDTAVAEGAAIHARSLLRATLPGPKLLATASTAQRVLAVDPIRTVVARAIGIKLHDSYDPTGKRVFVHHIVMPNTALPVEGALATFSTVVDGQERVRIELMEQAGSVPDPEIEFNRRVLDGELTGLPEGLPAGSPIDFRLSLSTDGRMACVATERSTGRELVLASFMEGVADGAESEQQRQAVSGLMVRS